MNVSRDLLVRNLRLVDDEGYLTRAAMLAFHPDPERWVTGAYVKIGYFEASDSDLRYQDEVHGPVIEQAAKVVDLVYTKLESAGGSKGEVNREDNADNREDNADNQTLVMKAITRNPHLTVRQLATELPISKATVERTLKALQKIGKLRRVGGTRGVWEIIC